MLAQGNGLTPNHICVFASRSIRCSALTPIGVLWRCPRIVVLVQCVLTIALLGTVYLSLFVDTVTELVIAILALSVCRTKEKRAPSYMYTHLWAKDAYEYCMRALLVGMALARTLRQRSVAPGKKQQSAHPYQVNCLPLNWPRHSDWILCHQSFVHFTASIENNYYLRSRFPSLAPPAVNICAVLRYIYSIFC